MNPARRGPIPYARGPEPPQILGISIIGTTNSTAYRGVIFAEAGVNVKRLQCRYFPEQDVRHQTAYGETFIRTVSMYASRELVVEGEILAGTGLMGFLLGAVCTFANQWTHFGTSQGTFLLDEATVTEERDGWVSVSIKCSSNPWL